MADITVDSSIGNLGGPFESATAIQLETPTPLETTVTIAPVTSTITSKSTIHSDSVVKSDVRLTFGDRFDASVDLKPVSADVCAHLTFGSLPPTRVRQPYRYRSVFAFLGFEIGCFEVCGELETTVEDAPRRPVTLITSSPTHGGVRMRAAHAGRRT